MTVPNRLKKLYMIHIIETWSQ